MKHIYAKLIFLVFLGSSTNYALAETFTGGIQALAPSVSSNSDRITALEQSTQGAVSVDAHPLIAGKVIRNADVTATVLAIAFQGQIDGVDIPYQSGVVRLNCSPECPETGLLLPRFRIINPDSTIRDLPVPTLNITEIIGSSITGRISTLEAEKLLFSNGVILEIVAPRSDPRILMYVQDTSLGGEVSVLWDVWLNE